jgi:MFS transporter, PPP family, 3-phenylpropionic acid transporter
MASAAAWLGRFRASVWPYAALSATYFAHIGFFNPFLPLWLHSLGYSLALVSLMVSMQSITRLYAPYAWGWLADRYGHAERLMRIAATGAALVSLLLWVRWPSGVMLVVLLLLFTQTSAMMPMSETALVKRLSDGGVFDARRYGRVRLWGSVGFLVTVSLAGVMFERQGMDTFVQWTTGMLVLVVLACWAIPSAGAQKTPATSGGLAGILGVQTLRWLYAQVFFHVLAHAAMYVFFSLYLDQLGYSKSTIGALWAASVVAEIIWFFTQSRWMHGARLGTWLVVVSVVGALRFTALAAWAEVSWVLWLSQLLHAFTFAAHHTLCMAFITRECPPQWRGRAQALYTSVGYGLAALIAGLGGGVLADALGLRAVFVVAALSATAAVFMAWQVARHDRSTEPGPQPQ